MSIIRIVSNIIMVFASVSMISAFGISKCRDKKYVFISAAVNLFFTAVAFALHEFHLNTSSAAVYLMMYFSAFRIVFGKIKLSHIYIAIMSDCITSLLSSCFYVIMSNLIGFDCYNIKTAALLSVRLTLLLTVLTVSRSEKVRRIHLTIKIIPKHIFILTSMSVMFISLLAENNGFTEENSEKLLLNAVFIAALTVSLTAIIFSLLISVVSKKQVADTNLMLKNMVDSQLRHYTRLEKLNDDIRAFRHDYINHMRSIFSLLEMNQTDDAKEYTRKLIDASPIRDFSFQTGNSLANAILTDKNDLCGESAEIVFYGFIPDRIDNADLCVILSNSLDNAAEACAECEGQNRIEVCAQERQGYFVLTVRNPTADQRTYSCIPDTIKPDALNHGFGLRNIETVVKKHDGHLSVKCENSVFELSLTFKL